jgi:hypothetical protein
VKRGIGSLFRERHAGDRCCAARDAQSRNITVELRRRARCTRARTDEYAVVAVICCCFKPGETWHDQPLHDREHPHDLFEEVSVSLSHRFAPGVSAFAYFGYSGEPALGPPTFMHRISAMDNPGAPLGHHWQDSTHVTVGAVSKNVKLEGSVFTGREPGENRYDFDRARFDSFSGRVS